MIQTIAKSLLELQLVNGELDRSFVRLATLKQRQAAPPAPEDNSLPPLTPEHRRFLRFKSYSYPFLTEESWNSTGLFRDTGEEENVVKVNGEKAWLDIEDDNNNANEMLIKGLGTKLGWTDFLSAQETNIGPDEIL